jgi:hypothetical protein
MQEMTITERAEAQAELLLMRDKTGRDGYERALSLNLQPGRRQVRSLTALHELASALPLTRRQKEKAEALGLRRVALPHRARGEHLQVQAVPGSVERFVEAANPADPADLVAKVAGAAGYSRTEEIGRIGRRVARYMAKFQEGGRMPRHIRDKAITLDAMAQGVRTAFPAAYAAGAGLAEPA